MGTTADPRLTALVVDVIASYLRHDVERRGGDCEQQQHDAEREPDRAASPVSHTAAR